MVAVALSRGTSSDVNSVAATFSVPAMAPEWKRPGSIPYILVGQGRVVERRRPGVRAEEPAGPGSATLFAE